MWVRFFSKSDPISREPEGPGVRAWYSMKWGSIASLAGGLLFSLLLLSAGYLPKLAALAGGCSPAPRFDVKMVGNAPLGITNGVPFRRDNPKPAPRNTRG